MEGRRSFASKLNPPLPEAAGAQDGDHGERELLHVRVELVGVPAEQRVAGVRVDRAQHPLGGRDLDLVLEGVAGERRVVGLDVELEVLLEAEGAQEGDPARDVEVVLVLRRLLRLGLDVELALEPDPLRVVDRHVQEPGQVLLLPLQVRVEERLVALAAAPERVAVAAELVGDLHRLLHLGGRVGEDVGVGVRGGAAHVARVGEQVGRAPEEPDARLPSGAPSRARPACPGCGSTRRASRPRARCPGRGSTRTGASIFCEELERRVHPALRDGDRVPALLPRAPDRARAEGIAADAAERVPVGDREAQALLQRHAVDHLVGVVVPEGQRILGLWSLVACLGNREELWALGAWHRAR